MLSALPQVTLWDFCALKHFCHFDIFIFFFTYIAQNAVVDWYGAGGLWEEELLFDYSADVILVCSSNMLLRYYLEIH